MLVKCANQANEQGPFFKGRDFHLVVLFQQYHVSETREGAVESHRETDCKGLRGE